MRQRVRVQVCLDAVAARGRQAAETLGTESVSSVREVLGRQDLQALLLLDSGWQGDWLVDAALASHRPVFLGRSVTLGADKLAAIERLAEERGLSIVPELPLRYLPTTIRLRELTATRLGGARQLTVDLSAVRASLGADLELSDVLDWCRTLLQKAPVAVEAGPVSPHRRSLRVDFTPAHSREHPGAWRADTLLPGSGNARPPDHGDPASAACLLRVVCESGSVEMTSDRTLHWTVDGQSQDEQLANDRAALDVMLDLFARRVLGGLIPIAGISDLRQTQQLVTLAEQALAAGHRAEFRG
jgi:predicted dehydrogenase